MKGAKATHHAPGTHPGDKKSKAAKGSGATKKGGAGGKFTWGNVLAHGEEGVSALDRRDPNYDSDEERHVVLHTQQSRIKAEVQAYKQEVGRLAPYCTMSSIRKHCRSNICGHADLYD